MKKLAKQLLGGFFVILVLGAVAGLVLVVIVRIADESLPDGWVRELENPGCGTVTLVAANIDRTPFTVVMVKLDSDDGITTALSTEELKTGERACIRAFQLRYQTNNYVFALRQ